MGQFKQNWYCTTNQECPAKGCQLSPPPHQEGVHEDGSGALLEKLNRCSAWFHLTLWEDHRQGADEPDKRWTGGQGVLLVALVGVGERLAAAQKLAKVDPACATGQSNSHIFRWKTVCLAAECLPAAAAIMSPLYVLICSKHTKGWTISPTFPIFMVR